MTSSLLTIYAHVRPSLSTLETTLCLCVYLCIYLSQISYISIYLSLSLFVLQWSHSIISVISLCIPNHFFPIYLVCSFNLRCILSFFSLFPNLSLYVSFMPLPFATLGTLLRLFFSSVSFCNVYHIQCLLIFSLPVFVKKCSNWLLKLWQFHSWTESLVLFFFLSFFQSNPTR